MRPERGLEPERTVVSDPAWVGVLLWVVCPVLGAGAGSLLRLALGWVADRSGIPTPGWVRLIGEIPEPWFTGGALVVGFVAGLGFAAYAVSESLTVTVGPDLVRLTRADHTVEVLRVQVRGVYLDGQELVLVGAQGDELAREPNDQERDRLERAFTGHGYRWHAEDPYRDAYSRWVPQLPQLPPGADALFEARQRALERDDESEARELRTELARLGVVVRDRDKRQYWRLPDAPRG